MSALEPSGLAIQPSAANEGARLVPLDGDARPWSKESSLARAGKRHHRQTASSRRWSQIAESKGGPCKVCGAAPPNQLHHLIARSQGGADTEANIVALCQRDHALIEARDPVAGLILAGALTDLEYAYCVDHFGESFFERRLGVVYSRA